MSFFNCSVPPLRRKQVTLDVHNLEGLWQLNWQIGQIKLYSNVYTCIDQAFIIWALLVLVMFAIAQFLPVSWSLQATLWSILSIFGTAMMVFLTQNWVKQRQVTWVLYSWVVLMLLGVILTDLSIIFSWGIILANLCPLWLSLSALGYLCNGLALRSRTQIVTSAIHILGIFLLPFFIEWQFIYTGIVMVLSLFILAEFEWDHQ